MVPIAALLALSVTAAQAQTAVSVQFTGYWSAPGSFLPGGYSNSPTGYYAGAYTVQYWNSANNCSGSGDGVPVGAVTNGNLLTDYNNTIAPTSSLLDSTGATSSMTFSLTNATQNRYSAGGGGFPDHNAGGGTGAYSQFNPNGNMSYFLQSGVEASTDASSPVTLALGGLNAGDTYDVYAYVSSLNYAGAKSCSVTLGGETFYLTTDAGSLSFLTQSLSTDSSVSPTADYVEFTNISGALLNSELLTVDGAYTGLSGFQVIDLGAAPEPSTIALFAVASMGLAFQLGRKRRSMV